MPDGKLLRFDKSDNVPADKMLGMAYSAARSERVEVACESRGGVAPSATRNAKRSEARRA
jgi:hypothetical protein